MTGNVPLAMVPISTVADLLAVIRTTMPWGGPGSLTEDQYLDVVAYVLERNGKAAASTALTADILTGAGGAAVPPPAFIEGEDGLRPSTEGPTQEELNAAHENTRDWLYHTHDYTGRRFVALSEINTENVADLRPACMFQVGDQNSFQTGPIVYDGVMYVTTADHSRPRRDNL